MKRNIKSLLGIALGGLLLTACSDSFLEDKKNYDNFTSDIYDNYESAKLRVNAIYGECLPNANAAAGWNNNQTGVKDDQSEGTEEHYTFGAFLDPTKELSAMTGNIVPDYFQYQQNYLVNVWGRIRGINDAIAGLTNSKLSQEEKDELLGQCYFFRGWCYYQLMKWYGGVPIITEAQETEAESFVQRSPAKAVYEFIISDLNQSANLLKAKTANGKGWDDTDWGRVTSGTALALKGRVMVLWCSPMFNRSNDPARWTTAYNEMKADLATITSCGYDLYGESAPGMNGEAFAKVFSLRRSSEAVFVKLYNNFAGDGDNVSNCDWERNIRPYNTQGKSGGSGYEPTSMLFDLFPMKDGKRPGTSGSNYTKLNPSSSAYDKNFPFMDRDPRFYRTYAFPGVRWAYKGDASEGDNYALWNYVWYANSTDEGNPEGGKRYGADNLLDNVRGIYVRKRSDDLDVNTSPLYTYDSKASKGGFTYNGAPYIEIRFAEVLLNLAEAACGAKDVTNALVYLNRVRSRAGVPALTTSDFAGGDNQASCMSAILYERQVELAFEGKRFDDMRRWMLFDGGDNVKEIPGGAPSTWTLTGWGGNTCAYLGMNPINNNVRRERVEFAADPVKRPGYGTKDTDDPIKKAEAGGDATATRCAPLDLRKDIFTAPSGSTTSQQDDLKTWYTNNLIRRDKGGDAYDNHVKLYAHYFAKYYFLGLSIGALNRNDPRLSQTIGWEGKTGMGTFDPLAE